jgi:hypothetical protein
MPIRRVCYTKYHPTSLEVQALRAVDSKYAQELATITAVTPPLHTLELSERADLHDAVRKVYKEAARKYKKMMDIE